MGMYDTVEIEEGVELPEFDHDPSTVGWQTKDIGHPIMREFRITEDGRLLRHEVRTEETDEPMEWTEEGEGPTLYEHEVVDETWVDHNQHGSFEFHTGVGPDGGDMQSPDVDEYTWYSYEARFTEGELDEIVLLQKGDR